jgi:hypothetical protein
MARDFTPTNAQRALVTFLGFTLAGPFFAALALVALRLLVGPLNLGALLPANTPPAGALGLAVFVWAVVPATLAALALAALVLARGALPPFAAAAAGVVAFVAATVLLPVPIGEARVPLAVLAGGVALAVRGALRAARLLP